MANIDACYRWAATRHGVISRPIATGFISHDFVDRLVREGKWTRRYPGVYIVSPSACAWRQELMALQWWLGDGGVVAGISAARLHDLEPCRKLEQLQFIIDRVRAAPGSVTFRRSTLRSNDIVMIDGFRVTDVHRTLLDLGRELPSTDLEAAVEDAFRRRKSSVGHLTLRLKKYGGKGVRGCAPLRKIVDNWGDKPVSQSWLALKVEQSLRVRGIPPPVREFVINDDLGAFVARVDLAWPNDRVVVDVQSRQFHEQDPDWQADKTRFNRLGSLGWTLFQVTHKHWRTERIETLAQIRRAITGK